MSSRFRLQPDELTARATVQDVTMLMGTWAILYGAVTILGGDPVWMIPAYDTAQLVPYSPESWGWALLACGALIFLGMFSGKGRIMRVGLFSAGLWNFFFSYSFLHEYVKVRVEGEYAPGVGLGPVVTYAFVTLLFLSRVNTYRGKNALPQNTP